MKRFSTRAAARKLGISHDTLATYIRVGKVPAPESVQHGERTVHIWTEEEIEHVRKLLPKIANGRKTRYQKKQSAVSNQRSAKRKTQPGAAARRKTKKKKK